MKKTVGGTAALAYAVKVARKMGISPSLQALYAKNTCKSCAFGTGGQNGGIRNEAKQFPEFCKKNLQTQLSDLQAAIPVETFSQCSIANLDKLDGRLTTPLYKQAGDTHYQ